MMVFMEFGRYEIDHDSFGGMQLMRACCDGRYKLAIHLLTSDELYDLETDPYEMENLIDREEHGEIRDRLHDRILDWMNETRDPFRGRLGCPRARASPLPVAARHAPGLRRRRVRPELRPGRFRR